MSLKDHTTDSAKLSEEQIESIIAGRVKYDPQRGRIVFLPDAKNLSSEKRILLYMVALRGWEFVVGTDTPLYSAKPQKIGQDTGVRGGTARPILKNLADNGVLVSHHGSYEAPAHNLQMIADILLSDGNPRISAPASRPRKATITAETETKKKKNGRGSTKGSLAGAFKKLLEERWFEGGKTTSELKDKLREMAVHAPVTSLPKRLIGAYHAGHLTRKFEVRDGKEVLVYSQ